MKRILAVFAVVVFVAVWTGVVGAADELSGTYISRENRNEYITFGPGNKFYLKQKKKTVGSELPTYDSLEGTFKTEGDNVTLTLPGGGEATGKFKGGMFMDNEQRVWIKEGTTQKMPAPPVQPKHRSY